MTITEPELAETEIDPQARKVRKAKLKALTIFLLDAGEEEGGNGDGSPTSRGESGLLRCAGTHRLPRIQAQDCSGAEREADIQGGKAKGGNRGGLGVIFPSQVIPMMNPDGVYLGNYRGSLLGEWTKCTTAKNDFGKSDVALT